MQSSSATSYGGLARLLYTHNPFYLVSALLVLIGLHKALGADSSVASGWLLMGLLASYTVMLALAGFIIVRFGQVWDDARMILLVILLLFVSLSVSFDKIVLDKPVYGARFLLAALGFAVVLSEGVFVSLGIRLAGRYRVPYYLLLALLFAYPIGLGHLSVSGHDATMAWRVFLFPGIAAVVLSTLWPAARTRGIDEPANGTPWAWPWFPWSLFVFLLLVMALRSHSLCMAFESAKGSAVSFQPYFLAPLVLVAAVLLLEAALANHHRGAQSVAMALPIAMICISLPGTRLNPVAGRFLAMLTTDVGSPMQLTLVGAGVFYVVAWLRGLRAGELGVVGCLGLASGVDSHTVSFSTLTAIQWLPMAAVATIELSFGIWRRSPWRVMVGSLAAMLSVGPLVGVSIRGTYGALRASPLAKGLPWLLTGMASLAIALLMSFAKGGLLTRSWRTLRAMRKE